MLRVLIFHVITLSGLIALIAFNTAFADQNAVMEQSRKALEQTADFKPETIDYNRIDTSKALKQSQQVLSLEQHKTVLPTLPKLDLLSIPAPKVDIDNLVKQGQKIMGRNEQEPSRYESQILVFVSSSMPLKTIRNYLQQTTAIDAAIVFRGFKDNSMLEMKKYIGQIVDQSLSDKKPTILIDPTLYDRFDIQQVPVTLVTESEIKPCQQMPCPTPVYHTVSGDVALPWALSLVSRQIGSDALKSRLRPLIKELESM